MDLFQILMIGLGLLYLIISCVFIITRIDEHQA